MDALSYIIDTMKQATNEVGFIPASTVADRYLAHSLYVLQQNRRGTNVGYVLHGKPRAGGVLTIAQALVDVDQLVN